MHEPSEHVATFKVSGVQHWDAAKVIGELKTGYALELVANASRRPRATIPPRE